MIADRIIAFLDGLSSEELQKLPPARLRQFSDMLYQWHVRAETAAGGSPFPAVRRPRQEPPAGVLSRLKDGERPE